MPPRAPLMLLSLLGLSLPAAALNLQIDVGSIEHPGLPAPITTLHLRCTLAAATDAATCQQGRLKATLGSQPLQASFEARLARNGDWRAGARLDAHGVTLSERSGRMASEKLDLHLVTQAEQMHGQITAQLDLALPRGQAYLEPVFVDFAAAPAMLSARLRWDTTHRRLDVEHFDLQQTGVLQAVGRLDDATGTSAALAARVDSLQLGPAFSRYAQPFLVGTRLEKLSLAGTARGQLQARGKHLQRLALQVEDATIEADAFASGLQGLNGTLRWQAQGPAAASDLRWRQGHIAKLDIDAAALNFSTAARDLTLLAPLRLPMAGGALVVRELVLQRVGQADMAARFDAEIEPLDLATLCRAFGWPEFGGTLGGRLPGLNLLDRQLKLDGALRAEAFDGHIAVENLRVIDPFGRVPRVQADVRLRGLDLAALTGAFSFGRIEGRLDGDVEDLRLLGWEPVAFRARLATPRHDASRHRISQRAIDNISAIGGGPTGVLSRGALRFFKDFAYARIGWSCVLADGVCRMDGIKPAKNGGYVLVQGRLLPRIDVVGYNRRVDWGTFVSQVRSARQAQGVELR